MIKVAVAGYAGRMGSAVVDAVTAADDMTVGLAASIPMPQRRPSRCSARWPRRWMRRTSTCSSTSRADVVAGNLSVALPRGSIAWWARRGSPTRRWRGWPPRAAPGTCLFYAPNFTTGAVLMMEFAKAAAPYFPEAEVIEYHHCNKKDAPSGTAVRTAEIIAEARAPRVSEAPGRETEIAGAEGARGALIDGVPIHSVRSMGFVASQEVIFGSLGQTLTIRHDSWDRTSYMPGVLLGIRSVGNRDGLIVGLENFMN